MNLEAQNWILIRSVWVEWEREADKKSRRDFFGAFHSGMQSVSEHKSQVERKSDEVWKIPSSTKRARDMSESVWRDVLRVTLGNRTRPHFPSKYGEVWTNARDQLDGSWGVSSDDNATVNFISCGTRFQYKYPNDRKTYDVGGFQGLKLAGNLPVFRGESVSRGIGKSSSGLQNKNKSYFLKNSQKCPYAGKSNGKLERTYKNLNIEEFPIITEITSRTRWCYYVINTPEPVGYFSLSFPREMPWEWLKVTLGSW